MVVIEAGIAVQTILWGTDRTRDDPVSVFEEALAAGYEGVECRYTVAENVVLEDYLRHSPLSIVALHANLQAVDSRGGGLSGLLGTMERLGIRRCLFSSHPEILKNRVSAVRGFAAVARRCAERGVQALYHNHGWEFEAGPELLDRLAGVEDAGLALDIGWAHRAGQNTESLVRRYGDRIRYVHLKDTLQDRWTELGVGNLGLERALGEISGLKLPWWTVEQDDTDRDPAESAAMSRAYLRGIGL